MTEEQLALAESMWQDGKSATEINDALYIKYDKDLESAFLHRRRTMPDRFPPRSSAARGAIISRVRKATVMGRGPR